MDLSSDHGRDLCLGEGHVMSTFSTKEIATVARRIYTEGPLLKRSLQHWRPHICPFNRLIDLGPKGSRVLDIGCGGGLFLGILTDLCRIKGGVGFDSSASAIDLAKTMLRRLDSEHGLTFRRISVDEPRPEGEFEVISLIDVMHHVPPKYQRALIEKIAGRVGNGGRFLYKDMAARPLWRGFANRMHDLVLAKQWIHYAPITNVIEWTRGAGLEMVDRGAVNTGWHGHEFAVFERGAAHSGTQGTIS